MKKFGKSIWVRAVAPVLCTVASLWLAISILATIFYAGFGGSENLYKEIYDEICEDCFSNHQ